VPATSVGSRENEIALSNRTERTRYLREQIASPSSDQSHERIEIG
jgi:hypothetical protein